MAALPGSTAPASNATTEATRPKEALSRKKVAIAVGATIVVVVLLFLCLGFYLWRRQQKWRSRNAGHEIFEKSVYQQVNELEGSFPVSDDAAIYDPVNYDAFMCHELPVARAELWGEDRPTTPRPRQVAPDLGADSTGRIGHQLSLGQTLRSEKRDLLPKLTIPCEHPSEVCVAAAHLASRGVPTRAYVDPREVEYRPNPVLLSHLRSPLEDLNTVQTPIAELGPPPSPVSTPANSASRRVLAPSPVTSPASSIAHRVSAPSVNNAPSSAHDQPAGAYEMDATETVFNPWFQSPMLLVGEVPHRWEQTMGTNKMFFDADRNRFPFGLKRKQCPEGSSHSSQRQRLDDVHRTALSGSWQESCEGSSATGTNIGSEQHFDSGDYVQTREFSANDLSLGDNEKSPLLRPLQFEKGASERPEQRKAHMTDTQRPTLTVVASLNAPRGQSGPDDDPSVSDTPIQSASSVRTSQSSLIPASGTSATSLSSFATQMSQSNCDFSAILPGITVSVNNLKNNCPDCDKRFRTPGQMRQHFNRKHNRRYKCSVCDAAFALSADLNRHMVNTHTNDLDQKPKKVFRCPNPGCAISGKEFFRKDNFKRHTKRCGKAKGKGKAKQEAVESPE